MSHRLTKNPDLVFFCLLHGFADVFSIVHGHAVYLLNVHLYATISVFLVMAKARMSPLRSITILRAELVAAYLLANLLMYESDIMTQVFASTDSAIVSYWLKKLPRTLKTFMTHRVAAF